ncbi:stealth family protein [Pectinatus sottacetonis]|uniref:stealth family protein n=1 Tax=Pectinatus sottacetonis TaxID=1002795 RepID=UPI0018C4BB4F|nr:stealth family protein [Pectinatus sottacetonis]
MQKNNQPIDFTVCWVDGSDPAWLREKAKYDPNVNGDKRISRYRDWDNLQYWFRGVEKFAPWVNKIHFITWGHLPKWLNTTHPKLNIVRHEDYLLPPYMPTFSSSPLELNLHRIKGLAEHFVSFNDDMYIIKPVEKELFFQKGLPTDFCIATAISAPVKNDMMPFIKFNSIAVLNTDFDKKEQVAKNFWKWMSPRYGWDALRNLIFSGEHHFRGFSNNHLPYSFLKNTYTDIWHKENIILDESSRNKFRSRNDVDQWLIRYWQLVKGDFTPIGRHAKGRVFEIYGQISDNNDLYKTIENQSMPMICINDNDNIDFAGIKKQIIASFNKILPEKSSFEK